MRVELLSLGLAAALIGTAASAEITVASWNLNDLHHQLDEPLRPGAPARSAADIELHRPLSEIKADLFKALAHPARIRVIEVLADGEHSVGDLQPLVGIELSHLSQQLGVLRRAGLLTARREGSSVFYSVKDPLLTDLLVVARKLLLHSLAETRALLADLDGEISAR